MCCTISRTLTVDCTLTAIGVVSHGAKPVLLHVRHAAASQDEADEPQEPQDSILPAWLKVDRVIAERAGSGGAPEFLVKVRCLTSTWLDIF